MGFFSSRRAEPSPLPVGHQIRHPGGEPKSTVRLIRSKFYGKSKPLSEYSSPTTPSIPEASDPSDYYINDSEQHSTLTLHSTSSRPEARRSSTDAVTMTLAQRLNELAVANSEGLVDDNEYRLLRQSLFERFASASTVPAEPPVVKMLPLNKTAHAPTPSTSSHKSSIMRTPSLRTQTSISSTMSSLFRRATRRAAEKRAPQDIDNIPTVFHNPKASVPITGHPPSLISQLSRQPSMGSITTVHSRHVPHDLRSISSKRSGRSQAALSDVNSTSRGFSRSLRSAEPPPSSFHPKVSGTVWYNDDDRLKTAADIRDEIRLVELEERRLLEAFNGLEITASTRHRQLGSEAMTTLNEGDNADPYEYRSRGSVSTPVYNIGISSIRKTNQSNSTQSALFSLDIPPVHSSLASLSSDNLEGGINIRDSPRSGRSVQQFQKNSNQTLNVEMDDIRQRRADIALKYQERLAFLRARLKGAEMHERLLRK